MRTARIGITDHTPTLAVMKDIDNLAAALTGNRELLHLTSHG
jgi:hypothetical protein